jgi:predicted transcriptional regulator
MEAVTINKMQTATDKATTTVTTAKGKKKVKSTTKLAQLFKALSDDMSIQLVRLIAAAGGDSAAYNNTAQKIEGNKKDGRLMDKAGLSRKQFYSRMDRLIKTGLVKRKNGRYFLTSFGKLIYYSIMDKAENAIKDEPKLKAIDSFKANQDIPKEELAKLIDTLVDDKEVKDVLLQEDDAL